MPSVAKRGQKVLGDSLRKIKGRHGWSERGAGGSAKTRKGGVKRAANRKQKGETHHAQQAAPAGSSFPRDRGHKQVLRKEKSLGGFLGLETRAWGWIPLTGRKEHKGVVLSEMGPKGKKKPPPQPHPRGNKKNGKKELCGHELRGVAKGWAGGRHLD